MSEEMLRGNILLSHLVHQNAPKVRLYCTVCRAVY